MEDEGTFKVLVGDPFGGYETVEDGLTLEAAEKLSQSLQGEVDYFTTTLVRPSSAKHWTDKK